MPILAADRMMNSACRARNCCVGSNLPRPSIRASQTSMRTVASSRALDPRSGVENNRIVDLFPQRIGDYGSDDFAGKRLQKRVAAIGFEAKGTGHGPLGNEPAAIPKHVDVDLDVPNRQESFGSSVRDGAFLNFILSVPREGGIACDLSLPLFGEGRRPRLTTKALWRLRLVSLRHRLPVLADRDQITCLLTLQAEYLYLWISLLAGQKGPPLLSKGTSGHGKGPVPTPAKEHIANLEQIVYTSSPGDFGAAASGVCRPAESWS